MNWQPSASLQSLHQRAQLFARIRMFFEKRQILEVETPLLGHTTVTDHQIHSISVPLNGRERYLQTSPEYAMKRLLAAYRSSIYQICKAFRREELGRFHQPEFTMLEWYRVDFDHHALMDEVDLFFQTILHTLPAERFSYANIFMGVLGIDPHHADVDALALCAARQRTGGALSFQGTLDRDGWLNLLFSHYIEPDLGKKQPVFIYDFPASQAALARIRPGNPPLASRFEVYYRGMELGNGFHELGGAEEQRLRFEHDLAVRSSNHMHAVPIDECLLGALAHGLPDCAGIALGLDRLMMIATESETIEDVLAFPVQ